MTKTAFFLIVFSVIVLSCNKSSEINNNENQEKEAEAISNEKTNKIVQNAQVLRKPMDAVVFSDNVNVRNAPNLSGEIIKKLNNGENILIYDIKGSNEFNNGIWDRWYKISNIDELWINAYYITHFPIIFSQPLPGRNRLDWYSIDDLDSLKNLDNELIESFRDNYNIRQGNFSFQITNERLVESVLDNLDIFEYTKKIGPDIVDYEYYEIVIDNQNNVSKKLFYDIKIGDSLEILSERLGIDQLPYELYVVVSEKYNSEVSSLNVKFYGENILEKIVWKIILRNKYQNTFGV
jgi:hypothetical protein